MRASILVATSALSLSLGYAPRARAGGFEGEIDMKMSGQMMQGDVKVKVSKVGVRAEMSMTTPMGPMQMVNISKTATPDKSWMVNDAQKAYAEIDLAEMKKMADAARGGAGEPTYKVTKLGKEKLAGYGTEHVKVDSDKGEGMELWLTKDLLDYETFGRFQRGPGMGGKGLEKALKEAGVLGFPVKVVHKGRGGEMTMEVTRAEKKSIPASTFDIPAGYTKQDNAMGMMMGGGGMHGGPGGPGGPHGGPAGAGAPPATPPGTPAKK